MSTWFKDLLRLFFPKCCIVCGDVLYNGEEVLCTHCNLSLPRTGYHLIENNPVEQLLAGRFPMVRATSYFFYNHGGSYTKIVHALKYGGRSDIGVSMGRIMANELSASHFFSDIDLIVPIPLHPKRQRERGYNQSESLAKGLSAITGIPVSINCVRRRVYTKTQTKKSFLDRIDSMKEAFELSGKEEIGGKHILVVDDVLTTGSTLTACIDAMLAAGDVRFSVLTLTLAGKHI